MTATAQQKRALSEADDLDAKAKAGAEFKTTGAEAVLRVLEDLGVDVIFGYPGGAVLPIYDALFQRNSIRHILVRHEQAAVHAAEGYARSTGKVGVVLVTSGPGATNAVTGLTDALLDSIPILCISGQVPTHLIGNDAFQEADTVGITRACTKYNYLIKDAERLVPALYEAFHVARSGRPGPVVVDLPKDIQFAEIDMQTADAAKTRATRRYRPVVKPPESAIKQAADMLLSAQRPVIYGGGGIINAGDEASKTLAELVALTRFPATLTLMGLGALPAGDKHFLGMLGMHGTYEANMAMYHADVMLNIGARFDDRVTGLTSGFSPNSRKIHIDIDKSSIDKNIKVELGIVGDAGQALKMLVAELKKRKTALGRMNIKEWWEKIADWRSIRCLDYDQKGDIIKPQYAIHRLWQKCAKKDVYVTTEVGQHQMWAAQYFGFNAPRHWMTSGGLGTMGYGLPSAMGVQIAHPDKTVIDIAGEASFMMNMQELSTIAQYQLPVKVFIINNEWMGMVRQWQELIHGGRYSESYSASLPDFVKLADCFGMKGISVARAGDLDGAIDEMLATKGAVLMDVRVAKEENCFPMIPSGAPHNQMLLGPNDKTGSSVSEEGKILL